MQLYCVLCYTEQAIAIANWIATCNLAAVCGAMSTLSQIDSIPDVKEKTGALLDRVKSGYSMNDTIQILGLSSQEISSHKS